MRVVSIIGYHRTGKTTTVVNLISELRKKGFSVSSVKDIHQDGFTMEKKGSNSWLHLEASESTVFARSHDETYQIWRKQLSLKEMLERINTDWFVLEGMKNEPVPKIVCAESIEQLDELVDDSVIAISGKISDQMHLYKGLPIISNITEMAQLTEIVISKCFEVLPLSDPECCSFCGLTCDGMCKAILKGVKTRDDCRSSKRKKLTLSINDSPIDIVPFVENTLEGILRGYLSNLKGYKENSTIRVDIQ